jgi:hypothetical protein
MTWSAQQEQALIAVRKWFIDPDSSQIFRLFGFAGTGKTTLSQEIANLIEDDGDGKVVYAAFTGKAALVMRQKGRAEAAQCADAPNAGKPRRSADRRNSAREAPDQRAGGRNRRAATDLAEGSRR